MAKKLETNEVIIFTDGACSKNPGPGGWAYLIYFVEKDLLFEAGGHEPASTNNKMEIEAAIQALDFLTQKEGAFRVRIQADSKYLIDGITQWIKGWKAKNWIKSDGAAVQNQEHWKRLEEKVSAISKNSQIEWSYVPAHSGIGCNERVDEVAVAFSKGNPIAFFSGSAQAVGLDPVGDCAPSAKAKKISPQYLSFIEGKLETHTTWAECENRVRGKANAKFKKVVTEAERTAVLSKWGLNKI